MPLESIYSYTSKALTPRRRHSVRKIAARFGIDPSTVQRISRPFDASTAAT